MDDSVRVVLVLRQSPDWRALAAAQAEGRPLAATAYVPSHHVPTFPDNISDCIARWDASYRVGFFDCRAELQSIAAATLAAVANGLVLRREDVPDRLPAGSFRLFFLDDDDWFAPDTVRRMAGVGEEDVAVFPLLRLDAPPWTFVRQLMPASPVIGRPNRFSSRYQTNNYGLHPRVCTAAALVNLADHMIASHAAEQLGLRDAYHDVMVSVTNKTPVSASVVPRILSDEAGFRRHVEAFVLALRGLALPEQALWMREPVRRTAALFERALGGVVG